MIGELNLWGVFVPALLLWGLLALGLTMLLRRLLARVGLYRWVWHRALFDVSLFVILWGAVAALSPHLGDIIAPLL